MHIFGMLRVKNEARWIRRVIEAIQPVCERIFVLDDHSTDGTPAICTQLGCDVFNSTFSSLDESRDKDWLLNKIYGAIPLHDQHWTRGNPHSPYWCLAIDGDEELVCGDEQHIRRATQGTAHSYHLRIPYLWNDAQHIRVDRVYRRFESLGRPSLFRLMNQNFRFLKTPFGKGPDGRPANFHCSSIPQELLHGAQPCAARLMHWGYLSTEDRIRKYRWYNTIDPENEAEDRYRHIVQGDVPEVPAGAILRHAGPLQLEAVSWQAS